jgi:prevent-host-death family protein
MTPEIREQATVGVHEAKTHLSKLLQRVAAGETIVITRAGKRMAELRPVTEERPKRRIPGLDRGLVIIHPDFDDPLPEFEEYM